MKTPLKLKKWQKYPRFENTVSERNFKHWFRQPPYSGIRNLNVNFGAIQTLDEKVVLFTKTKELEGRE